MTHLQMPQEAEQGNFISLWSLSLVAWLAPDHTVFDHNSL